MVSFSLQLLVEAFTWLQNIFCNQILRNNGWKSRLQDDITKCEPNPYGSTMLDHYSYSQGGSLLVV